MRGLEINEDTLALDLIDQIGPDGDYLSTEHTLKHYREDWYPKLFDRNNYDTWQRKGAKTLRQRAREKALKILETHLPEPLPAEVQQQLDSIVEQYA
jgi:trimethylamine---corrinoid protein Co-methyltransferase